MSSPGRENKYLRMLHLLKEIPSSHADRKMPFPLSTVHSLNQTMSYVLRN